MSKIFCLPNLATDEVFTIATPMDFKVPEDVLALGKDEYKKRWLDPATRHCLMHMASGMNEHFVVSRDNPAAMVHGFQADYDGCFTGDLVAAMRDKPPGRFLPTWWGLSQSKRLHLVWALDRPIAVTGNAHANELLHVIATKVRAVRWGVGYDPECEKVTQCLDVGREWHEFREGSPALLPVEEVIAWDMAIFQKSVKGIVEDVVDIPFDVAVAELRKREWPHELPQAISVGTRCVRFWDASADNQTGGQFTKDGVRVYTPHDGGFVSWRRLLGAEFCEQYTARSMAPFFEDTWYCHTKDEYWRFFRNDTPVHFEKRTEKVLRRDLVAEARLSSKPPKGEEQSEIDKALYAITRRNVVDVVAPVIYRPAGRIRVPGIGTVLNTSLLTVVKPAPRVATVTPADVEAAVGCPERFRKDPSLCEWDNPFAVAGFPHVHHYLTALFMRGQGTFDEWAKGGFGLHRPSDGAPHEFLRDRQLVHLISWVAHFYWNAAKMAESPSPGTVLILAGPTGIGKSFFATELLGRLMGGWDYADKMYLEGSRFNSETVKKPVHVIDDKLGSKTHRDRLKFTEALKVVSANGRVRCEAKFGSAVEGLPWPGRVVILSNVDSQSLSVLPDLDMSTRDKFTMLRLGGAKYSFGTTEENQRWLAEELPAFARFLLGWRIPPEIRDERFGVKAVQHQDMAQASAENGLTQILVDVLDSCIEETTGTRDDAERGDARGWVVEGPAVKVFKWIKSVDDSLAREVVDARTLHQNLLTLYKSGGYNIAYDERLHRWSIPYVLRRQDA
jgi:hypothetical protein